MNKYRDTYCGKVNEELVDKEITLSGWVENIRDHGGVLFLDLRDEYGTIQLVSNIKLTEVIMINRNKDIVIDLNGQIPVSKITINITSTTTNDRNLVDIAKVEFLNNVYKEIPKPEMDIPVINNVTTSTKVAHESMEITWDRVGNITGYEVKVEEIDENGKVQGTKTFTTSEEYLKVRDIKAYGRYRISVQALNGEWQL